ncbi:MAG TPA: hypothetical protein PLN85_01115 [archaeon]|nr:hypothetical protein [archaeon]
MKNNNKQRLFEIMGKLDPTFKNIFLLNEGKSPERVVYRDLFKVFMENDFSIRRLIGIGYANTVEINKKIYPTDKNEEYARKLIERGKDYGLSDVEVQLISDFINSDDWVKTKSGEILYKSGAKKNTPKPYFDINPKYLKIVRFARYQFNFQDREELAKNFSGQTDQIVKLRQKYGFGKGEENYPEDDWRRKLNRFKRPKYHGLGIYPDITGSPSGSKYKEPLGNLPFFGAVDDKGNREIDPKTGRQKYVMRQNISTGFKNKSKDYFFVEEDGNMIKVHENFVNFFRYYLGDPSDKSIEKMDDEEAKFVEEMKEITGKYFSTQFFPEKLAFITATPTDAKTGEKKPLYFYNDNLDILEDFKININQLKEYIAKYIKISIEEDEKYEQ